VLKDLIGTPIEVVAIPLLGGLLQKGPHEIRPIHASLQREAPAAGKPDERHPIGNRKRSILKDLPQAGILHPLRNYMSIGYDDEVPRATLLNPAFHLSDDLGNLNGVDLHA